jgi:hypothetical protein
MMDWRDYQEQVAHLFRELGCLAEVEVPVRGARAAHVIDVWVEFERFGLEQRWVVECKLWRTPVPKEKVLTLKSVVEDVGADRGVLVAEAGFQPGAFDASKLTNIALTTLAELRTRTESDLRSIIVEELERKALILQSRTDQLSEWEETEFGAQTSTLPGVDLDRWLRITALLSILDSSFKSVKMKKYPVTVSIDDTDRPIRATDTKQFFKLAGQALASLEAQVIEQEIAIKKAGQQRHK